MDPIVWCGVNICVCVCVCSYMRGYCETHSGTHSFEYCYILLELRLLVVSRQFAAMTIDNICCWQQYPAEKKDRTFVRELCNFVHYMLHVFLHLDANNSIILQSIGVCELVISHICCSRATFHQLWRYFLIEPITSTIKQQQIWKNNLAHNIWTVELQSTKKAYTNTLIHPVQVRW